MVTTKKKVKKRKEVLGRVSTTKKNEITGNSFFLIFLIRFEITFLDRF